MNNKIIHHVCIQTNSYDKSLHFYTEILGFDIIKETQNFHNRSYNSWLLLNSFMIELQTGKGNALLNKYSSENEGISHMCFFVNDIKSEYKRIKELGFDNFKLKDGKEIYKVENSFLFKLIAPEGTQIEFRDTNII